MSYYPYNRVARQGLTRVDKMTRKLNPTVTTAILVAVTSYGGSKVNRRVSPPVRLFMERWLLGPGEKDAMPRLV
jgi:hypothetical protein